MTSAQRDTTLQQIENDTARLEQFKELQGKIDHARKFVDNTHQVNLVSKEGEILAISDADIISKSEAAVGKYIAAREAEQAAI